MMNTKNICSIKASSISLLWPTSWKQTFRWFATRDANQWQLFLYCSITRWTTSESECLTLWCRRSETWSKANRSTVTSSSSILCPNLWPKVWYALSSFYSSACFYRLVAATDRRSLHDWGTRLFKQITHSSQNVSMVLKITPKIMVNRRANWKA